MKINLLLILCVVTASGLAEACEPTTSDPEVALPVAGAATFYVDGDACPECSLAILIWIYEESNGLAGLQRSDDVHDDTCAGEVSADTAVLP